MIMIVIKIIKMEDIYQKGYNSLNSLQKEIIEECSVKKSGGMSLVMGSGKTRTGIVLALKNLMENSDDTVYNKFLVVCSKSLIPNWTDEINKVFGVDETTKSKKKKANFPYIVFHKESLKKDFETYVFSNDTLMVLTTPNTISAAFKDANLEPLVVTNERRHPPGLPHLVNNVTVYKKPETPLLEGNILYGVKWNTFLIDEVQDYTNIETSTCRSMIGICAKHIWALSGTMFNEPKTSRILGYYQLIGDKTFPVTLPDAEIFIHDIKFKGLDVTLVKREKNTAFELPKLNVHIMFHEMKKEEEILYSMMKKIFIDVNNVVQVLKHDNLENPDLERQFSAYLLSMIIYLRQIVVFPLIPLSSLSIDLTDLASKNEMVLLLKDNLKKLDIENYLNDPESIKSSRFLEVEKVLNKHKNERVVVFNCWRTSIVMFKHLIQNRQLFDISGSDSIEKRRQSLEDFKNSDNGVLFLSYQLGSQGLNLQCSSVVLLVDFFWNSGTTNQSIARVFRYGQEAPEVNVYYFTSKTSIEDILFQKQDAKKTILEELSSGSVSSSIKTITTNDILHILTKETRIIDNINRVKIVN